MPYVEFPVEPGCAPGIAAFYRTVFRAPAAVTPDGAGAVARVQVGVRQELVFRETREPSPPYDGHHIAIYIADFSGPHRWLAERGLVTEESSDIQYRFTDIVDPETARPLFTIEHEVRCVTHPMYLRPLINRNPAPRQATYVRARDGGDGRGPTLGRSAWGPGGGRERAAGDDAAAARRLPAERAPA